MKKLRRLPLVILLMSVMVIAGCGSAEQAPTPTAENTKAPTKTPAPEPTDTSTPNPTEPATITPTPGPLSATEVFDLVSPSVAYIETPVSGGSGMLLSGGYVLTNAHVIWPYKAVRIVFPDGSEYLDTPVVGWDLLADLAILGPIETDNAPLNLIDGEEMVIGSDVYLIGYPGEIDSFPQPTISRGLISRTREWESVGISFFQTDAALAGGQSGGVLASDRGEVIGISGLRFTEADFGIVASAVDLLPRAQQLIAGEPLNDIDARPMPEEDGKRSQRFISRSEETTLFVVDLQAGKEVEIELQGSEDVPFIVRDPAGFNLIDSGSGFGSTNFGAAEADYDGPHFVIVGRDFASRERGAGYMTLTSNRELVPYDDSDDDLPLVLGRTYYGGLDYPGDSDSFVLVLQAGDIVHIRVESIMIDPVVSVVLGVGRMQEAFDDDSGKGVLGTDAEFSYFAPHDGMYGVTIFDAYGYATGGYAVTADRWERGQPTPIVPASTPTPIVTELGEMQRYEADSRLYTFEFPADMIEVSTYFPEDVQAMCFLGVVGCYYSIYTGLALLVLEEDLDAIGLGSINLEEYADMAQEALASGVGEQNVSRETRQTTGDQQTILLTAEFAAERFYRLITIVDGTAISIIYFHPIADSEELRPIVDYSLGTLEVAE